MAMVERLGLKFKPTGNGWTVSHGQNPFAEDLGGGRVRLHFACRDDKKRSRGASLDATWDQLVAENTPLTDQPQMTLEIGALGAFDDCGAMPSSLVNHRGAQYLYYTGWSQAVTVPFSFHIGLAIAENGGAFQRLSQAPVLGRTAEDPFITGAPWVMIDHGMFRMWYISATGWDGLADGSARHYYLIKHAYSDDGIVWRSTEQPCVGFRPGEYALARPVVTRDPNGYRMLFSFRGGDDSYRVGFAQSDDGLSWQRDESIYLDVGPEDAWDGKMVCYAFPFRHGEREFLLYNGNDYGAGGFGVARLFKLLVPAR
jgi:hypothetical protein